MWGGRGCGEVEGVGGRGCGEVVGVGRYRVWGGIVGVGR